MQSLSCTETARCCTWNCISRNMWSAKIHVYIELPYNMATWRNPIRWRHCILWRRRRTRKKNFPDSLGKRENIPLDFTAHTVDKHALRSSLTMEWIGIWVRSCNKGYHQGFIFTPYWGCSGVHLQWQQHTPESKLPASWSRRIRRPPQKNWWISFTEKFCIKLGGHFLKHYCIQFTARFLLSVVCFCWVSYWNGNACQ